MRVCRDGSQIGWEGSKEEGGSRRLYKIAAGLFCSSAALIWRQRNDKPPAITHIPDPSPPLCPPVLEPGLDLGVGHLEVLGQGGPLSGGEVLLLVETLLELTDLKGER